MADYPTITKLSQLDASTPANTEVANKLDDAIRQHKDFSKTYLEQAHDDDGNQKDDSVPTAAIQDGAVTTDKVAGAAVTEAKLATDSVSTSKLKDNAVTGAKLTSDGSDDSKRAVGTDHIQDEAVTAAKLAPGAVGQASLGNDSVGAGALADDASVDVNRAVTTNHIRDSAVTNAKVADGSLRGVKLNFNGGTDADPRLMAGVAAGGVEAKIGGALTASWNAGTGTLEFAFASGGATSGPAAQYARLEERQPSGSHGGGLTAGDNSRGAWTEVSDGGDLLAVSGATITFKRQGTYLIRAMAVGYSVDAHRVYLRRTSGTAANVALGTTCAAPPGAANASMLLTFVEITADNTDFELRHFVETAQASTGAGKAVGSGDPEVFAAFEVFQLQAVEE